MAALQTFLLLMLVALVSSGSAVDLISSSSSSSSSAGHDGSLMQDEREQRIEQVLDELAQQVDSALNKLDMAAEIHIDIMFDASSSGMWTGDDGEAQYEEDEVGDEWVVVVPRSEQDTAGGVHSDDLEAAAKVDAHPLQESTTPHRSDIAAAAAHALAPLRAETSEWTALLPPSRWHDEFDSRSQQQLNAVPLSVLAAMSCVTLGIVASAWWFGRRARRRRNLEHHAEWAASVEYMDSMDLCSNGHDDDSDDGFGDFLDDGEEEWTMQTQEMAALERSMKTTGIRDGIEFGKEDTLQEGFDHGFATGAASSYRFSVVRGALRSVYFAAKACGLIEILDADERAQCDVWIKSLHQHAVQSAFASNGTQQQQQTEDAVDSGDDAEKVLVKALELLERLQLVVPVAAPASAEKPTGTIE